MATTFDNPLRLLRQLKGAPLSVFLACQIVRAVVTRDWLCQQTGYSENIVANAIGYLTEHNFIVRVTGGWMIASAAQLPLMAALPDGENGDVLAEGPSDEKRVNRAFQIDADVVVNAESEESQKNKSTATTTESKKRVKRAFGTVISVRSTSKDPEEIDACLAALKDAGIFGKRAEEIADSESVTVDYIKAHLAQVQNENWDNPLGMAIWRMGQGMPAPELRENGHIVGCRCSECYSSIGWDKYRDGKYSEFVDFGDDEESETQ